MLKSTDDLRISALRELRTPADLMRELAQRATWSDEADQIWSDFWSEEDDQA